MFEMFYILRHLHSRRYYLFFMNIFVRFVLMSFYGVSAFWYIYATQLELHNWFSQFYIIKGLSDLLFIHAYLEEITMFSKKGINWVSWELFGVLKRNFLFADNKLGETHF